MANSLYSPIVSPSTVTFPQAVSPPQGAPMAPPMLNLGGQIASIPDSYYGGQQRALDIGTKQTALANIQRQDADEAAWAQQQQQQPGGQMPGAQPPAQPQSSQFITPLQEVPRATTPAPPVPPTGIPRTSPGAGAANAPPEIEMLGNGTESSPYKPRSTSDYQEIPTGSFWQGPSGPVQMKKTDATPTSMGTQVANVNGAVPAAPAPAAAMGGPPPPMQVAQAQQPAMAQGPTPQTSPQQGAIADPRLGGLVPQAFIQRYGPQNAAGAYIQYNNNRAQNYGILGNAEAAKSYAQTAQNVAIALQKASEPTPSMKEYTADRRPNETMADYQARVAGAKKAAEVGAENNALTPEQKLYGTQGRPGESYDQFRARITGSEETAKVGAQNLALTNTQKQLPDAQRIADAEAMKVEAKDQAEAMKDFSAAGIEARGHKAQLSAIEKLGDKVGYGVVPKIQSFLGHYGVDTKGLTDIQAYERAIDYMAPQLRPIGSGRLLQNELSNFKSALGGLMTTPEGRRISLSNLKLITDYKEQIGRIASNSKLGVQERWNQIYSLEPPKLTTEIPSQKAQGAAPPPPTAATQNQFRSPAEAAAAVQSGQLKKGDTFLDGSGVMRRVP